MEIEPHEDDVFYDSLGMRLWEKRHLKVCTILESENIKRVCDLGCNDAKFIKRLTRDERYDLIVGLDVDTQVLNKAEANCRPETYHLIMTPEKDEPLKIFLYEASILKDCSFLRKHEIEAITLIEVIEHLERKDLDQIEENVFGIIAPGLVIVTTPNYEFNHFFTKDEHPGFRHLDHKFEMTRSEFAEWSDSVAKKYGYHVSIDGVGLPKTGDTSRGYASQIATFNKETTNTNAKIVSTLESQKERLVTEITYPIKKKRSFQETFLAELNYSYNFVKCYPDYSNENWEEDDDTWESQYTDFYAIKDLIEMRNMKKLTSGDPQIFLDLLEKNVDRTLYQLSSDRKGIKILADEDYEHNF